MKTSTFLRAAAFIAISAAASARAEQSVIDFDALATPGFGVTLLPAYSEDGYQLTTNSGLLGSFHSSSPLYAGSPSMTNTPLATTSLTRAGGAAFSLDSIELADLFSLGSGPYDVTFLGHLAGGGTVSQTFSINTGSAFSPHSFSGFSHLASVTWQQGLMRLHQFDNIVVTSVPEPGTYAMLLAGLGLFGWMSRRKRSA